MANRFVRSSKYRHVFGRNTKKEQCYDNLRISRNAWDTNLIKANPEYIAVNWEASGGGAFAVIPVNEKGRLPERLPLFRGHTATVLDTDWNPFHDQLIASGSDDGKIFLWRVPDNFTLYTEDGQEVKDVSPVAKLSGHTRKVGHVLFNPAAENILATASGDFTIKVWDVSSPDSTSAKLTLKLGDICQSLSWSADGSLIVTTSRDKKLRIWDVRQERPAQEVQGHSGAKNSRAVWMGEHDRIATTGFSRMSDRQLALWDMRAAREPLGGFQSLDSISGVCMPFWDEGTQCLYLAGKGDGNIRYFEYENDKFEYLSEYKSAEPQRGIAFLPKRGVNMHENEVTRAYKTVNDSYIEPISFIVPRRAEMFQSDVYPPCTGLKPAMSSKEWFDGQAAIPPKIDMESLYEGNEAKEVSSEYRAPEPVRAPEPIKKAEPEPPREEPVLASRGPPPSMKEQSGSIAALADKFADRDDDEQEPDDDASSFEEVSRPVERPAALQQETPISPVKAEQPQKTEAPRDVKPATASREGTAAAGAATWKSRPEDEPASSPSTEKPTGNNATPTSPTSGSTNEALEREVKNMKSILAQQSRTMAAQGQALADLLEEMTALKAKVGD